MKYSVPLYKSLQNIIVNQNKYLQVMLAEEQFRANCDEQLHADLFGQDLSQLVSNYPQKLEIMSKELGQWDLAASNRFNQD